MLRKKYKKPKFINPVIFKFVKLGRINFVNKNNVNIRSSKYLKIFANNSFSIHNGKLIYTNDPVSLSILFKDYPFFNFNLGQFSYTRFLLDRRSSIYIKTIIIEDLKKKRGLFIKNKSKKKKFIFKK